MFQINGHSSVGAVQSHARQGISGGKASVKIESAAIEQKTGSSSVKLAAASIEQKSGSGSVEVGASGVDIKGPMVKIS